MTLSANFKKKKTFYPNGSKQYRRSSYKYYLLLYILDLILLMMILIMVSTGYKVKIQTGKGIRFLRFGRTKGCTKPFHWPLIIYSIFIITYHNARQVYNGIHVVIPIVLPYYSNYLYSTLNLHYIYWLWGEGRAALRGGKGRGGEDGAGEGQHVPVLHSRL
jgi:hypothetical protein